MSDAAVVAASSRPRASLPACAEELLGLAVQLRRAAEPPNPDELRREIHRQLAEFERQAGAAGVTSNDVHDARYAMVALLDEIVLGSDFPFREGWASKPLQMELFNDFTAGEEFYRKLEKVQADRSDGAVGVLEIYGLCLGLGFMGKHAGLQGMDRLVSLRAEIARDVARRRGSQDQALAPAGAPERSVTASVRDLPVWVVAAACGGFILILYGILLLFLGVGEIKAALETL